jgi:hypothetical protein
MSEWRARKALYKPAEVADLLSYSVDTIYTLVMIGELVCHNRTPGRKGMRITGVSIEGYLGRHVLPVYTGEEEEEVNG